MPALIQSDSNAIFVWDDMVRYWELDDGRAGLHQDVADFLVSALLGMPELDSYTDADNARRGLLIALRNRAGQVDQYDDRLVDSATRMGRATVRCLPDARRTLQAQLTVVQGQSLFKALGCSLTVRLGVPSGAPDARANGDLADALEIWFES